MELSVEVSEIGGNPTFICRGKLLHGQESDYLFDLLTRPDSRDVVLDVKELIGFDQDGLSTILLCHDLLSVTKRKLLLRNASIEMLLELRLRREHLPDELSANTAPGSPGNH